ncbi:MAG: T9SS type A sorting domain-containing protein [Flavobacteriales bacterium]|nr:T9SS type A sorting domain-containing protein [Flavobacteriales bacterium]
MGEERLLHMKTIAYLLNGILLTTPLTLSAQDLLPDPTFELATSMVGQGFTTMAVQVDGSILAGGLLSSYDGSLRSGLIRLMPNGQLDPSFAPEFFPSQVELGAFVSAISIQPDGEILVGGEFGMVNSVPRFGLARLLPNGNTDQTFSTLLEGNFFAVGTTPNENVFAGGALFNAPTNVVAMDQNGSIVSTPLPNSASLECIHTQPDGKILLGFSGTPHMARLEQDGTLDVSFQSTLGSSTLAVYDIALLQDGRMMIIGNFDTVDGVWRKNIARLMNDGSLDTTFDPGAGFNNLTVSLDTLPGGDLLVASYSSTYDGIDLNGGIGSLVRLNDDGGLDTSYESEGVWEVLVQPDGKVLIAGAESMHFGDLYAHGVMRLAPDLSTSISESPQPELRIWPNPASDAVNMHRADDGEFAYILTDVLGQEVGSGSGCGRQLIIPLDHINAGTYLLRFADERGLQVQRIVKK